MAISVAESDPGSGAFFTLGSGMDEKSWIMNIRDHIPRAWKQFFRLKILKFLDADPGSVIFFTRDAGWENSELKHWIGHNFCFLFQRSSGRHRSLWHNQCRHLWKSQVLGEGTSKTGTVSFVVLTSTLYLGTVLYLQMPIKRYRTVIFLRELCCYSHWFKEN